MSDLENLPPKYKIPFYKNVLKKEDIKIKRKWLATLSETYTMIPTLWKYWIACEENAFAQENGKTESPEAFINFLTKMKKITSHHFYFSSQLSLEMPKIGNDGNVDLYMLPEKNRNFAKVITYPYYDGFFYPLFCEPINIETKFETLKLSFSFPHRCLEHLFYTFQEYSNSPIPSELKKAYDKNVKLFNEIMKELNEKNYEKMISLFEETNDESFVLQNLEYFIAEFWNEKDLWKFYIKFLENKNKKMAMLSVYSRYCRLFIDDLEMREKYFQEVSNLHEIGENNVLPYWIDIIKMEKDFEFDESLKTSFMETVNLPEIKQKCNQKLEKYFDYREIIEKSQTLEREDLWFMNNDFSDFETFKISPTLEKNIEMSDFQNDDDEEKENSNKIDEETTMKTKTIIIKGNFDNFKIQKFSFCPTLIKYISTKSPSMNHKLHQTCKLFFGYHEKNLCYGIFIKNSGKLTKSIKKNSMEFTSNLFNEKLESDSEFLKKFIITTTLHIDNSLDRKCFSKFLLGNCIFKIKYLKLKYQDFTLEELKFFSESCNLLTTVRLIYVNIFFEDFLIPVEMVVGLFPTAKSFYLRSYNIIFTEKSAENLANLKRKVKFLEFVLCDVTNKFMAEDFCEFIKKHMANYGRIKTIFRYPPKDDKEYKRSFVKIIEEFLKTMPITTSVIYETI